MSFRPSSRLNIPTSVTSPDVFFQQAPQQNLPEERSHGAPSPDNLFPAESVYGTSGNVNTQPSAMNYYRRDSITSHRTRRSVLVQEEPPFTPVRNLAIMDYQKRSIFSNPRMPSASSSNSSSRPSYWSRKKGAEYCGRFLWKGHERVCLGVVLTAIVLIIVGGIVGTYFAFKSATYNAPGPEIQQQPRIGVRVGSFDGHERLTGNDLVPVADYPIVRHKDRFGLHDLDSAVSKELDCNELYTFRCGQNQCLPIPVWCDGKFDCDDKSDEPDDCASICPPRFFACLNHSSVRFDKTHDWCIPETLVCNGIPDCEDLSDEYFCRCNAEQIRCTDGICKNRTEICRGADSCMSDTSEPLHCNSLDDLPPHKFCDGFPDIGDALDEIECSVNCESNDQFSCWRSGYGCVHKSSVCDSIRDCSNGEDEEECLRLLADGESMPDHIDYVGTFRPAGILLVRRWGTEFSPICITSEVDMQADSYIGTMFCNHFGYARLLYSEPLVLPKQTPTSNTKFYNFNAQATTGDPSRHFIPVKQCDSGSVLRIHCTEMMCESRLNRNKGVVVTENGELILKRQEQNFPFIVQIYKRVWSSWVLRCGGVLVHPLWLVTSSGCIDKNGYFKVLSGPYWQSTNPKLMQNRDISMIAMPPERGANNGRSEIVLARLDRRVECHDFLRPACLPEPGQLPTNSANMSSGLPKVPHCVTMGWNVTANKASNIPFSTELHIARDIQIVSTEDCSRSLWNRTPESLETLICVRISGQESTNVLSDPGGVLACSSPDQSKWELMGVLSGYKTRVSGNYVRVYALYSRLDQHLSWITKEFASSDTNSP